LRTRALDFLNSIATPVDTSVEWIESGQDLLSWLAAAGLIPPSVRAGFQKSAVPGELDAVAARARALREWFRSFVQKDKGSPLRQDALKELEPGAYRKRERVLDGCGGRRGDPHPNE
jgi:hypothetical protein